MATLEDLPSEARDELALLARELSDSPDTRKEFLRLARMKRPTMPVPELELDDRLTQVTSTSDAKIAALEAKLAEKDMRAELDRRRQAIKEKGLAKSDDDVQAIEKLMLEKGITNHDTAAEYHKWMSETAAPTPPAYNRNFMDPNTRRDLTPYWKNPVTAARDEAAKALTELRKNPKAVGF
jgi:hypothetical protein